MMALPPVLQVVHRICKQEPMLTLLAVSACVFYTCTCHVCRDNAVQYIHNKSCRVLHAASGVGHRALGTIVVNCAGLIAFAKQQSHI